MKLICIALLIALAYAQVACREQVLPPAEIARLRFRKGNRRRDMKFHKRSIVRCKSDIEVLNVPERAVAYHGVPLGAVVTIVETDVPLHDKDDVEREALPICSGIFISATHVLSSAHCVFHQRRHARDAKFWMYGEGEAFLYAITGKVSESDEGYSVYPLSRGCIPQSYIDAEDEDATSGMENDVVMFETATPFRGNATSIAELADELRLDEREYLLFQYPSDVGGGERLVIDRNVATIRRTPYENGTFWSVDLASWSGSSGGPIIDVKETDDGKPVVVGILMSSGWGLCDSGIVPVVGGVVNELMDQIGEFDGEVQVTPLIEQLQLSPSQSPEDGFLDAVEVLNVAATSA